MLSADRRNDEPVIIIMIFRNPYFQTKDVKVNGVQQFSITYDNGGQGKIMQKTDIGNYSYDANKIHQLKYLTSISNGANPSVVIGTSERNISYTSFLKTATITENNYQLTYTYGSDRQRIKSELKQNGSTIETKLYWGDMELVTKGGVTSEIYYISGPAGLSNIIVKKNGVITRYNAYTDQLGSILAVTDASGGLVAEQNFDAWGRKRNPANWSYTGVPTTPDWLYRGYTGHEHVAAFNLINMNGRMYDPMTGLMLSPDNYVPLPFSPGGYNRYLYANGNPLKFVDPDGEFFFAALLIPVIKAVVIGAVIGGATYTVSVAASSGGFNNWSWGQFGKSVGIGPLSGAVTYGIGNVFQGTSQTIGNVLTQGLAQGVSQGGFSVLGGGNFWEGFASGALGSYGAFAFGEIFPQLSNSVAGTIGFGALAGGIGAEASGGEFWRGALVGGTVAGLNHVLHTVTQKNKETPWDLNGDGKLQKNEADNWWRKGKGQDIEVDNGKIDWTGLTMSPEDAIGGIFAIETHEAFLSLPYETASTYGGTSFRRTGITTADVLNQKYHYNYRPNNSVKNIARNFGTWWGKPIGRGFDFNIRYNNPNINFKATSKNGYYRVF